VANDEHLAIFQQGVEVWNAWRKANPNVFPNLEGAKTYQADLRGIDLHDGTLTGLNLHFADLRDANLAGAYLVDAYLGMDQLVKIGAEIVWNPDKQKGRIYLPKQGQELKPQ
jgi:hypothetical protein